jgi:DNA-binding CsgD family transcriptional regulator
MQSLEATDERRVGRFVVETADFRSDDEPFVAPFLAALRRLVPCDDVCFSELDRVRQIDLGWIGEPNPVEGSPEPEVSYWEIRHGHPTCHRHETTGDFSAHRVTDFVTHRQLRRSRIYAQWFRPQGVEHQLTVGLDAPLWHTKVFLFSRGPGRDFTSRDCDVLDVLRPYLAGRYELWRSRQGRTEPVPVAAGLTSREREVLELVGDGLTNVEVAQRLWISPGTVRRHLENSYAKLGVHTRTAAIRAVSQHLQ